MSDDRDLGPILRDWLHEVPPPDDRAALAGRIVEAATRTPRGDARHRGGSPAGGVVRRLSALAAVIALGALAWAALALVGPSRVPGPSPSPTPPTATSPAPSPTPAPPGTWVRGTATAPGPCATVQPSPLAVTAVELRCPPVAWTLDDPRLTGTATPRWRVLELTTDAGTVRIRTGGYTLVGGGGTWDCTLDDALARDEGDGSRPVNVQTVTCSGRGAHAGLTAVLVIREETDPVVIEGLLLTWPLPPLPGAVPSQAPATAPAQS